jgi:hypothetical protein
MLPVRARTAMRDGKNPMHLFRPPRRPPGAAAPVPSVSIGGSKFLLRREPHPAAVEAGHHGKQNPMHLFRTANRASQAVATPKQMGSRQRRAFINQGQNPMHQFTPPPFRQHPMPSGATPHAQRGNTLRQAGNTPCPAGKYPTAPPTVSPGAHMRRW